MIIKILIKIITTTYIERQYVCTMNEKGHNLVKKGIACKYITQEVSKTSPVMFNDNTLSLNKHFFNPKQHTF